MPALLTLMSTDAPADRIQSLDDEARYVLRLAAVLGAGAPVGDLAAFCDEPVCDVIDALDRSGGLASAETGLLYFDSELVPELLTGTFSRRALVEAHARAAAITAFPGGGGQPDRLARHAVHALAAAGRTPDDAMYAIAAARAAARALSRTGAFERAADLLSQAASVAERLAVAAPRAELLVERAQAELACGRLIVARHHFAMAATQSEAEHDPCSFALAALGLSGVWVNEHRSSSERRRVAAMQRRALHGLPADEAALRCRLQMRLAADAVYDGGPLLAARDALAEVRSLGDAAVLAEALSLYHHCLLGPAHARERLALADEQICAAAACGDRHLLVFGLCWRTVDLFLLGDDRAEQARRDLLARLATLPVETVAYVAANWDVMTLVRAGRLDEAEQVAQECLEIGTRVGDADAIGWYGAQLAAIRWLQGRSEEVLPCVEAIASSPTLAPTDVVYRAAVASVAVECGREELARTVLARFGDDPVGSVPPCSNWMTTMMLLAQAAAGLGDTRLAARVYDALSTFAGAPIMPSLAVMCFGSAHRPLGLAARTMGRLDLAVTHFERAVEANIALGNRPAEAIARAELAETLAERDSPGDGERAIALLHGAAASGDELGLAKRAAAWRHRAGELHDARAAHTCGRLTRTSDHWVVAVDGREAVVAHGVGMHYLAQLVSQPSTDIPALALVAGDAGLGADPVASRQPLLDDQALGAYRQRLQELEEDIDDAYLCNDPERAARGQLELDALMTELESACGWGGRARCFTTEAERARTSVRKALKRAIERVADVHPVAAAALRKGVQTGATCRYDGPMRWTVST